ncbi:MAG: hypothetical protein MSG78_09895 [Clostridiales bacterium]|nr:hypothetical protein [Clostridiales bacterium]
MHKMNSIKKIAVASIAALFIGVIVIPTGTPKPDTDPTETTEATEPGISPLSDDPLED